MAAPQLSHAVRFHNAYTSFELPPNWKCQREHTETVCTSRYSKKAKAAIAAGEDINYEGASGNVDFDENGDVSGLFSVNTVGEDGKWSSKLLK